MTWLPIWVLPNIVINAPVEGEYYSLVPNSDPRVRTMRKEYPKFRRFLSQFYDTFKTRIHPSLILMRGATPERLRMTDAAGGFRDLLVASSVPYAHVRNTILDARRGFSFSDYFWLYPWRISLASDEIIATTPAMMGVHEPEAFRGQSSPELSPALIRRDDFDEPLLQELLRRWTTRFSAGRPKWEDLALFRSLNMTNQALHIPAGADATIHDHGRMIALWVSAFEILVHPGGSGQANLEKVFQLLENVPWINQRLGYRQFETGTKKTKARRNLACWLYKLMNARRNDFLHGNPVNPSNLLIPESRRPLYSIAPVLFRLGLTSFLDLSWKVAPPPIEDAEAAGEYIANLGEFEAVQRDFEEAVRLSRVSVEQQRRERQALVDEARRKSREIAARVKAKK